MSVHEAATLGIDIAVASANLLIVSSGLFVIYGLFRVVNMAHGDLMVTGAYAASLAQNAGAPFVLAALSGALAACGVALAMEQLCIARLRERSGTATLLATWGLGLILSQTIRLCFGSGGRYVTPPIEGAVSIFGVLLPAQHVVLLIVAAILIATGVIVLRGTRLGLELRAHMSDPALCELSGINTRRLFTTSFALGGALAGLGGALVAPLAAINPSAGSAFSVSAFMVIISGGLGDTLSPLTGALLVGGSRSILNAVSTTTIATLGTLLVVALVLVARGRLAGR